MEILKCPPPTVFSGKRRSEVHLNQEPEPDPVKEFSLWLLWSGISPESKLSVSRIGIYTDFT